MIHDAPRRRGLGDGYSTAAQVTNFGGAAAGIAVTATTVATTAAVAVPIIGAAVLAVTLVLMAISKRNAQKRAATAVVNDVEPQLKINRDGYLAGPRTLASQAQALKNFDVGWAMVAQACAQESYGSAGERCISERIRGGSAPWCPSADHLGCDWFALYRDPIEQDTTPTAAPPAGSSPITTAATQLGLTPEQAKQAPMYLAIAAIALGVLSQ